MRAEHQLPQPGARPQPPACPKCGTALPPEAPAGLCPKCLMQVGLGSQAEVAGADPAGEPTAPSPSEGRFVPPGPEELAPRFPQLEILELIGSGGMGAVYKARQPHLERLVALKILPPQLAQDPAFEERFTREARALAKLSHPHIVTLYDFGRAGPQPGTLPEAGTGGHREPRPEEQSSPSPTRSGLGIAGQAAQGAAPLYYLLMEYVDGTNLRQVIRQGQLQPKEALAIVPQICDALQYAHDQGVVHRDIKPENILLDRQGRVKIADFGLAKIAGQPPAGEGAAVGREWTLTATGQVMGTPHYMAPEPMKGSHAVDHRADIYSLGVVFYEMLTGELPIGRFEPPSRKVQVDVRLDEVVLRALENEPERRYQKASEVKTDIETISSGRHQRRTAEEPSRSEVKTDVETISSSLSSAMAPPPRRRHAEAPADWNQSAKWLRKAAFARVALAFIFFLPVCEILEIDLVPPELYDLIPFVWLFVEMLLASLMFLGSHHLKSDGSRGLAISGGIAALIPTGPFWAIGFPLGLHSLSAVARLKSKLSPPEDPSLDFARQKVRGPAIALLITGWLSGVLFLFCAGLVVAGLMGAWQYATLGRWGGPAVEIDPQFAWLRWPLVGLGLLWAVLGAIGLWRVVQFWIRSEESKWEFEASASRASHQKPSTLHRAFADWWAERDRWVTSIVKTVLLAIYVLGLLTFFSSHGSGKPGEITYEVGTPTPWCTFEYKQGEGYRMWIRFDSLAWLALAIGSAAYYAWWQIRRAEATPPGRWSSLRAQSVIVSILALLAMTWGLVLMAVDWTFRAEPSETFATVREVAATENMESAGVGQHAYNYSFNVPAGQRALFWIELWQHGKRQTRIHVGDEYATDAGGYSGEGKLILQRGTESALGSGIPIYRWWWQVWASRGGSSHGEFADPFLETETRISNWRGAHERELTPDQESTLLIVRGWKEPLASGAAEAYARNPAILAEALEKGEVPPADVELRLNVRIRRE